MGVLFAILAMLSFGTNMLITRYAVARMPIEAGFLVVIGTNVLFPLLLFPLELGVRAAPFAWDWKGFGLFTLSGVIGTFLGRRALFDTVRLLGPSLASVFHSSAPAFAFVGAWLLAGERLGLRDVALIALVWFGLWLAQPGGSFKLRPGERLRSGVVAGVLATAGFGLGNVVRGLSMRAWQEAFLGTAISAAAAFVLQVAVTRDWSRVRASFATGGAGGVGLYVACGIATSLGSIFVTLAMKYMEIGLAVLIVHTTPLFVIPASVFILRQHERITGRMLTGAALILCGIAALLLR